MKKKNVKKTPFFAIFGQKLHAPTTPTHNPLSSPTPIHKYRGYIVVYNDIPTYPSAPPPFHKNKK